MARYLRDKGLAVLRNGYEPIPIKPGTKAPKLEDWPNIQIIEATIGEWTSNGHARDGIGVRTKHTPAVDIDVWDEDVAREIQGVVEHEFGFAPLRIGQWPKRALLYRTDKPFPKISTDEWLDNKGRKNRVEILGIGRQLVVYADHPDTKQPYYWPENDGPEFILASDLYLITEADAHAIVAISEEIFEAHGLKPAITSTPPVLLAQDDDDDLIQAAQNSRLGLSEEEIRADITQLDPNDFDREGWFEILCAIVHETEKSDFGHDLALEWSEGYDGRNGNRPHDPKHFETTWNSIGKRDRPRNITFRHIKKLLRKAVPDSDTWIESPKQTIRATPLEWIEPALIPPRRWLYGKHLIRGFPSSTIATGGRGKTTLLITEALAMTTGRALLGDLPSGKLRVWVISTEDPKEELQRRIAATCIHYGITERDIGGRLFLNAGQDAAPVVAIETREGLKIITPTVEAIRAEILTNRIDVVVIDPFVDSHEVNENDNTRVAAVLRIWARIAEETDCAIELSHHSRKTAGGDQTLTVDDSRGATSIIYKVRDARIINVMTSKQAASVGIANPRSYLNIASGKGNLAPPPDKVTWLKLTGERLGNGADDLSPGDDVGVIESWEWPDLIEEITDDQKREILARISKGIFGAAPQSKNWVGKMAAEVLGIDIGNAADRALVSKLLKDLRETNAIKHVEKTDEHRNKRLFIELDQGFTTLSDDDDDDI